MTRNSSPRYGSLSSRTGNKQIKLDLLAQFSALEGGAQPPPHLSVSRCATRHEKREPPFYLPPDLRISEADGETEDLLLLGVNLPGLQVDSHWHADVEATLGEKIDQHGQGSRVVEEHFLGVDSGYTRNRMAHHDGHHLVFNEI